MKTLLPTLISIAAAFALTACGGGGGAVPAAGGASVVGCTGKAAALFALAKGSYTATAATFDNNSPTNNPATVAGFTKGSSYTVTVSDTCTVTVGSVTMTYKDGSYAEFPGTGVDAGKTQYDVDLIGSGVGTPHFERFTSNKRGLSLFDTVNTNLGIRFDE